MRGAGSSPRGLSARATCITVTVFICTQHCLSSGIDHFGIRRLRRHQNQTLRGEIWDIAQQKQQCKLFIGITSASKVRLNFGQGDAGVQEQWQEGLRAPELVGEYGRQGVGGRVDGDADLWVPVCWASQEAPLLEASSAMIEAQLTSRHMIRVFKARALGASQSRNGANPAPTEQWRCRSAVFQRIMAERSMGP